MDTGYLIKISLILKVLGQKLGLIKKANVLFFIENKENYESIIIFLNLVCPMHINLED